MAPVDVEGWHWWPEATSTFAGDVDRLFLLVAVIVGGWLVFCLAALVWYLQRGIRQRGVMQGPVVPSHAEVWGVAGLGLAVLVCDLAIEAYGHPIWRSIISGPPQNALVVQVAARQFVWDIRHPGMDRTLGTEDDIELQNELHVPVHQPVELRMRSRDVIHSFFVPTVRLKQDVLPGVETRRWFVPTRVGTFLLACAELCGFAHYRMGGLLVVHDEESYRRWLAGGGTTGGGTTVPGEG